MSEHQNSPENDEYPVETPYETALALPKRAENDQNNITENTVAEENTVTEQGSNNSTCQKKKKGLRFNVDDNDSFLRQFEEECLNANKADKSDASHSKDGRQSHGIKPVIIAVGGWNSLWLIALLVFGLIFLWNAFYQAPRYEIPIMLLVKLVEQGNPDRGLDATTDEPTGTQTIPYILVEEGKGKKIRKVKYSQLNDISISSYEVSGKVIREVLSLEKDKQSDTQQARPQEVDFYSGRQGIPFDNNELFNYFKENGFENVSAKGPPGFWESYGVAIITTLLLLFFLYYLFQRLGAGAMAMGRNRDIQVSPEDINISFLDVAGVDEAVDELREIVEFLQRPEKFSLLGGRIPKGVLLVGPPGTGKTLLAKAVAGEAGVPFFSLSGSDFVEIYAGVGAARVRDLFQQAEWSAPCIIFIDELDALGKTRSGTSLGGHDEREQTLNALLVEMDGFGTNTGIIIIAATNRPEILDSALLRSGRFDRQVLVDRPDIAGREDILRIHSKQVKLSNDIDLHQIASMTSGFVGADLAALVNEAALLAARVEKSSVTMDEFTEAVERVTTGLQKKRRVMTDSEKQRVSWHECGHAIVATLLPYSDPVHKVSIIPRGLAALGYTLQRPEDEHFLLTKRELESRIQTLLAGTIAEEIAFSDISTGAQNDLERASEIARNMVMCFGMSHMGKINYHESRSSYLNESSYVSTRLHSEETAWKIDQEVQAIIEEMYRQTKEMLMASRDKLDRLATRLLEKEVIDSDELKAIIDEEEKKEGTIRETPPGTQPAQKP